MTKEQLDRAANLCTDIEHKQGWCNHLEDIIAMIGDGDIDNFKVVPRKDFSEITTVEERKGRGKRYAVAVSAEALLPALTNLLQDHREELDKMKAEFEAM